MQTDAEERCASFSTSVMAKESISPDVSRRTFSLPGQTDKLNLIVACTGSVASIKIPQLLEELSESFNIILLPSHTSLTFFDSATLPKDVVVFRDSEEWAGWKRGDPILHIELKKWVDVLLIAPLSAHTLAKIAGGLSDTLLLEVLRAWDYSPQGDGGINRILLAAPAMNTAMYMNPFTDMHITTLCSTLGFKIIPPITKVLACGDTGTGAMAEVSEISQVVRSEADHRENLRCTEKQPSQLKHKWLE